MCEFYVTNENCKNDRSTFTAYIFSERVCLEPGLGERAFPSFCQFGPIRTLLYY